MIYDRHSDAHPQASTSEWIEHIGYIFSVGQTISVHMYIQRWCPLEYLHSYGLQ